MWPVPVGVLMLLCGRGHGAVLGHPSLAQNTWLTEDKARLEAERDAAIKAKEDMELKMKKMRIDLYVLPSALCPPPVPRRHSLRSAATRLRTHSPVQSGRMGLTARARRPPKI